MLEPAPARHARSRHSKPEAKRARMRVTRKVASYLLTAGGTPGCFLCWLCCSALAAIDFVCILVWSGAE